MFAWIKKLRLKLVADAKDAWKWSSVRFIAVGAAVQTGMVALPERLLNQLPEVVTASASTVVLLSLVLAAGGRVTELVKTDAP